MTVIVELTDKNFKIVIRNMIKDRKKKYKEKE